MENEEDSEVELVYEKNEKRFIGKDPNALVITRGTLGKEASRL